MDAGSAEAGPPGPPDERKLRRGIATGLVLAVVVYGAFALWGDLGSLERGLGRLRWPVFVGACALSVGNYALRWLRWQRYLGALDVRIEVARSLGVFGAGFVLTLSPGKLAELYKVSLLRQHAEDPPPVPTGVAVVMAERLTDLLGMVVLLGVGLLAFPGAWPVALVSISVVLFALVLLGSAAFRERIVGWLRGGRTERLAELLEGVFEGLGILLRRRWLVEGTLLSTVAWSLQALALGWLAADLGGSEMTWPQSAFAYSAATLGGVATLLPGGLGATELGLTALVVRFAGLSASMAAMVAVLIRAATLWLAVLLGGLAWALLLRRRR